MLDALGCAFLTFAVTCGRPAAATSAQLSGQAAEVRDFYSLASPTVYAATQGGGVQKSVDNGATWARVATLPARYVWKIAGSASDPNLLFAATNRATSVIADAGQRRKQWSRIDSYSERIGFKGARHGRSASMVSSYAFVRSDRRCVRPKGVPVSMTRS